MQRAEADRSAVDTIAVVAITSYQYHYQQWWWQLEALQFAWAEASTKPTKEQ